jgi:hypothetical protein
MYNKSPGIPGGMLCTACDRQADDNDLFCGNCGSKILQVSAESEELPKTYWHANSKWQHRKLAYLTRQIDYMSRSTDPIAVGLLGSSKTYKEALEEAIVLGDEALRIDQNRILTAAGKHGRLTSERRKAEAEKVMLDYNQDSRKMYDNYIRRFADFEKKKKVPAIPYLVDNRLFLTEAEYLGKDRREAPEQRIS